MGKAKKQPIDCISLIVAIVSLIATIQIGITANEIAERNQNLQYAVTASSQISALASGSDDPVLYTIEPLHITHTRERESGELLNLFLATVAEEEAEITLLNNIGEEHFVKVTNNGMMIDIPTGGADNYELFFSPSYSVGGTINTINNQVNCFHLVFKGYNNSYSIFTVVYTLDDQSSDFPTDPSLNIEITEQKLNVYIFNENTIYDEKMLYSVAADLNQNKTSEENNASQITAQDIFDKITAERTVIYNQLVGTH